MPATLSLVLNVARIQYHKYQKGQKGRKLHRLSGSYLEGMFEGSRRAGKGKGPESRRKRVCDFADVVAPTRWYSGRSRRKGRADSETQEEAREEAQTEGDPVELVELNVAQDNIV